jgi:hypothetical protein
MLLYDSLFVFLSREWKTLYNIPSGQNKLWRGKSIRAGSNSFCTLNFAFRHGVQGKVYATFSGTSFCQVLPEDLLLSILRWNQYTDCATGFMNQETRARFQKGLLRPDQLRVQPGACVMSADHSFLAIRWPEPDAFHRHLAPSLNIADLNLSVSTGVRGAVLNEA